MTWTMAVYKAQITNYAPSSVTKVIDCYLRGTWTAEKNNNQSIEFALHNSNLFILQSNYLNMIGRNICLLQFITYDQQFQL